MRHKRRNSFDISKYKPQENSPVPEAGGMLLAINEKELLLLELFPSVARKFLRDKRIAEWKTAHPEVALNADQQPKLVTPCEENLALLPSDYEPADGMPSRFGKMHSTGLDER